MHELSIAMSILDMAADEAKERGASRVLTIHLRLGPLSGVVKEALLSAYELARECTPLADCRLVIEAVPVVGYCPTCQSAREVMSVCDLRCAQCGTTTAKLLSGRELEVRALEIQ